MRKDNKNTKLHFCEMYLSHPLTYFHPQNIIRRSAGFSTFWWKVCLIIYSSLFLYIFYLAFTT